MKFSRFNLCLIFFLSFVTSTFLNACNTTSYIVTVTVSEPDLLPILQSSFEATPGIWPDFEIDSLVIQPEGIHLEGIYEPSGEQPVPGSIELMVSAAKGELLVEVLAVQIPGIEPDESDLQSLASNIADAILESISGDQPIKQIDAVRLLDNAMAITLEYLR